MAPSVVLAGHGRHALDDGVHARSSRSCGRGRSGAVPPILTPMKAKDLLRPVDPLGEALQFLGLWDGPVSLLYSMPGMIIALVHVLIPFVVISVWVSLQRCDPDVERAGASLGANEFVILRRLVLPQIVPGIVSGSIVVFSLAATAFATPAIIGGRRLKVAATAVYDEFLSTLNWPLGAAIAVTLLVANLLILAAYNRMTEARRRDAAGLAVLTQKEQL